MSLLMLLIGVLTMITLINSASDVTTKDVDN